MFTEAGIFNFILRETWDRSKREIEPIFHSLFARFVHYRSCDPPSFHLYDLTSLYFAWYLFFYFSRRKYTSNYFLSRWSRGFGDETQLIFHSPKLFALLHIILMHRKVYYRRSPGVLEGQGLIRDYSPQLLLEILLAGV